MNDARVKSFRESLHALLEALDAKVRIARWDATSEAIPEPLTRQASELDRHLGAARKLAGTTFSSSTSDVLKVRAMRAATERLAAAYTSYSANHEQQEHAAMVLDEELGQVRRQSDTW